MIKSREAISMAEAMEFIKNEESEKEVKGFLKKFVKLTPKEAKELRKKINSLPKDASYNDFVETLGNWAEEKMKNHNKIEQKAKSGKFNSYL